MDHPMVEGIRQAIETGPEDGDTRITDSQVWRAGKRANSCAVSLATRSAVALIAWRARRASRGD